MSINKDYVLLDGQRVFFKVDDKPYTGEFSIIPGSIGFSSQGKSPVKGMITDIRYVDSLMAPIQNIVTSVCNVEPMCNDAFHVGDRVKSLVGSAEFIVSGFEYEENRVVCRPINKSITERQRYSYAVYEIAKEPDKIHLHLGCTYLVNNNYKVIVIEHPSTDDVYCLLCKQGAEAWRKSICVAADSKGYVLTADLRRVGVNEIQQCN